jgi:hypothetical protein
MRPHRLTATTKTASTHVPQSRRRAPAAGTGVLAAAQIGKAIISVPMIRSDLAGRLRLPPLAPGALAGLVAALVLRRILNTAQ